MAFDVEQKVVDGQLPPSQDRLYDRQIFLDVFLDKTQNSLSVVLRDVLRLIFIMALFLLFPPSSSYLPPPANFRALGRLFFASFKLDLQLRLIGAIIGRGVG